jgi:nucleoside-diphosphate-sugar epimerase
MKVLITGHKGYIGSVMAPVFQRAGHTVAGLDNYLFHAEAFYSRKAVAGFSSLGEHT